MTDNNSNINNTDTAIAADPETALKLDNQLCFALYVCSKEIIKKYKPLLEPLGLTYTGYITMMALWEEDEINVKDLGQKLYLDSGTLTPLLKKLEAQNYITRIRSTSDERNVVIKLTELGKALKINAYHIPYDLVCSVKFEAENAMDLLSNLHSVMKKLT